MTFSETAALDLLRRVPARAWLAAAVLAALILFAFRMPIVWMFDRWAAPDSDYSHGFIVPLVALYLVWRDRRALLSLPAQPSYLGLLIMLAGLLALLLSGLLTIYSTAAFGLILTIWGLSGFLFGRPVLRRLLFPVFILLFMLPLPLLVVEEISLKMKLLAAKLTSVLLDGVGILSAREGSTIYMEGGGVVQVGNACSGLRSLISLVFLGLLAAYISNLRMPRKIMLFLASIPIAVAANIVRVFGLCLIANHWGNQAIKGFAHDASGLMIYVIAIGLLFAAARLLEMGMKPKGPDEAGWETRPAKTPREAAAPVPAALGEVGKDAYNLSVRVGVALVLLGLAAVASGFILYPKHSGLESVKIAELPLALGNRIGLEVPVEDYIKRELETDDVIQRKYLSTQKGEAPIQMALVFSAANRRVAHPPEVCYQGSGWEISSKIVIYPRGLPEMVRLIVNAGSNNKEMVIYCFKAGGRITASYYRQQYNIARNQFLMRPTSSALIRFSSPVIDSEDQTEHRLLEFIRQMLPEIQKALKT